MGGVLYLLVRKTRRCWPAPHSCCRPLPGVISSGEAFPVAPPCNLARHSINCHWTHFHSVLDGNRDAAPTFFEAPLGATKYYISVYAPYEANVKHGVTKPKFRLTLLADIGAYPRPGLQGRIQVKQVSDMAVELMWDQATFVPVGVSSLKSYHVFSSLLLATEDKENDAVLLNPSKVMNTVCGLERNAVKYGKPLTSANCRNGVCNTTVTGIVPRRRYMLNIVSESQRGLNSTYAGIIVSTDWEEATQVLSDSVIGLVGAICGSVFGVVVMGYLWIVKLYN